MDITPQRNKFTKKQIDRAWTYYSSTSWIHEQSDALLELDCLKTIDFPVAMSVEEIAERTGLSQKAVRNELNSAYAKLKQHLSEYERK